MSTHKYIDRVCALALALTLAVTVLFMGGKALGLQAAARGLGYEERLFDAGRVHTLDIIMDGWEDFLSGCEDKEYAACTLVIDGEACRNVAIRAKGNSSLSTVSSYGNNRYSFKVEFDHYDDANTYYGLDKLSLNNLIQDNTLMKDFLCYQLMGSFGVAAPLCSYVSITVNGEPWGLYLAVEGVEDAFLRRNYGTDAGELYKPDSLSFGGDRGGSFDPADFSGDFDPADFAKRHGEEFTRLYLRTDKMLSHVGQEIVSYLARQVNECLSKAEYALLSYVEYAGRSPRTEDSDCFSQAVAKYLTARRKVGSEWVYAFEKESAKARCLELYPQMYAVAQAMYIFARETGEFKDVARTDGPDAWPNPKKIRL